jgi:hypothetical protein
MKAVRRIVLAFIGFSVANVLASLVVRRLVPAYGGEADGDVSIVSSMSGVNFKSQSADLRSIKIVAYMGGVELDLTGAQIVDGAVVSIRAVMGGVEVTVPETWRVEMTSSVFMGGVANNTDPDAVADDAPVLVIDTVAVMGGVEVGWPERN